MFTPSFMLSVILSVVPLEESTGTSLTRDAAKLGSAPETRWVSAEAIPVKLWPVNQEEKLYLVVRFEPDSAAAKEGKAVGKILLGFSDKADGATDTIREPAEGKFELIAGDDGSVLRFTLKDVPDKEKPLDKRIDSVEERIPYRLESGKLSFPKGLDVGYWCANPSPVRHKEPIKFLAK